MKFNQPIGAAEGAAYIDANPALGVEGSPVPAAAIEAPQREIMNVITGAGLVAAAGDLTQLRQAITKMIQSGQRAVIINNAVFAGAVTGTGKAVYWDSSNSRFDLALADGTVKQNCVGFADVANANVYAFGDAVLFAGLTPGARYYLSGTTAGAITVTAPDNAVFVGIARSATEVFVDVDGASLTVTSTSDPTFADNSIKPASTSWIRSALTALAAAAGFAASFGTNGYIAFPVWFGNWIIQWGQQGVGTSAATFSLPTPFLNAAHGSMACHLASGTPAYGESSVSTTQITLRASSAASTLTYLAWGK